MAGPWFTVMKGGSDWKLLENIRLTNGEHAVRARVEYRVEFDEPNPDADSVVVEH
ncbi:MAG: hypothetical protein KDB29_13635 [Planctomycetes bacterium]|nr:hypothetical protein [Planctomycetota bacterium]